jgi:arylsulfatase A-like enzyme
MIKALRSPEFASAWFGFSEPWRSTYVTEREASPRVPFIVRWPGKVPVGAVNNALVHEMALFPTLVRLAGGNVPTDRVIDGVDQTDCLLGKQEKSNREGLVIDVGHDIHGVKWRNWKMMSKEMDSGDGPVTERSVPRLYNLLIDPKEEHPAMPSTPENFWIRFPAGTILTDHAATLTPEPRIRSGTPDPSRPPQAQH